MDNARRPRRRAGPGNGGELSRSLVWRDLLRDYDVRDVASAAFVDRFGCWGFLDLWRSAKAFDRAEMAFLADLIDPITTALRRTQATTFLAGPVGGAQPPGPAVLLLSGALDVQGQTAETQEYLRLLVPPDGDQAPVPAGAYNVAAQLLAMEAGVDTHPASSRVHLVDGLWLTVRAARIGSAQPPADRDVAVTIETSTPPDRAAVFARAYALSARENEVLGQLVTGGDTREVAARMFVSENTVQDHLKSVFAKTGARSRRALLSRVAGT